MIRFPAEWEPQAFVQLTWPHENTDWCEDLDEAYTCFIALASAITRFQNLVVVCAEEALLQKQLAHVPQERIQYVELPSNDTWARDHGGLTVFADGKPLVYDFQFNGWGQKFEAGLDNALTAALLAKGLFPGAQYQNQNDFVLEGGALEFNGAGILLTTTTCLLSKNRNEQFTQDQIEARLKQWFGLQKVLWLQSGYLAGDDTDSHIDTLARFVDENTIMYVAPPAETDEHYEALVQMEQELQSFTNLKGEAFTLVSLPFPPAVYDADGERLPATYANFLLMPQAVLVPVYGLETDAQALEVFARQFPNKEVLGIDCSVLIRQHGSLHCVTMQYPEGV